MNKKNNKILLYILLILLVAVFIYSSMQIFIWVKDTKNVHSEMSELESAVDIHEIPDDESTQIIGTNSSNESNPYLEYMQMNLMDVNFQELEKTNSDVRGWINVNGTNINYPFVQATDNLFYLSHSFNKSNNSAGWVFMDCRNNTTSFDKNTILYAHARVNRYMFGSLKNTLSANWLNNINNHIINLSTKTYNSRWQIFSVYHIPTTTDYIQTQFKTDDEFINFQNAIKNRSIYDFNTSLNKDDKILTLSTCYGNNEKLVVHAKLIKYSYKE